MGRKINVEIFIPFLVFFFVSLLFYYQIFLGQIPINGNLLVSLWPPLNFLKWPEFPTGVPFKFMGVDEVREFYPLLDFTFDSMRSGIIPLWNPYNFSGYSHIGNWASAVFYPLHAFIFVLSKPYVFILLKLSAIVFSGLFTYFYLRTLNLSRASSYFGAIAFSGSATMQIWNSEIWQSTHAFLWLPLVLFSIEKFIRTNKIQFVLVLAFSIAMSIMAGYIQPTIYLLIVSSVYALFRVFIEKKEKLKRLLKIISGIILGFGMASVQLFPAIEAYLLSPRSQIQLHDLNISFLLPLSHIVTFFVPDFFGNIVTQNWLLQRPGQYYENMIYIGVVPLVFLIFSFYLKKYFNYFVFFAIAALISLSLTFDFPTSRLIYDLKIPFLSSAIPIRVIFITCFAVSVLSALGLEWWLKEKDKRKTFIGTLPLFLIFAGIGSFIIYSIATNLKLSNFPDNWYFISARNFVIPTVFLFCAVLALLLGQYILKLKKYVWLFLILLLLGNSFLFTQKYISFSDKKFLYPSHQLFQFIKENQGISRYWGYGSAALPNNFATVYKIYSPEGYDPVNISYYNELLSSSRRGEYEGVFSRSDALLYAVTEFPFKDVDDPRYRIMDTLGVKHIGFEKSELSKIEQARLDPSRYEKVWEQDNFIVFENKKAYPRVFLADRFVLRTDKEESLKTIYDRNIDLRSTVVVSENISIDKSEGRASAEITSYSPNRVTIEVDSDEPKILVLSDAYYPGWKAKVNNAETKIYRANHALRAIVVPRGSSSVVFSYDPLSFKLGMLATIASIFAIGVIYLLSRKYAA
jgi:uncharacterized membrane protein YfhO